MFELIFAPHSFPFAVALTIVLGLFLLEFLGSLLETTVLGLGGDGPDVDINAGFDVSTDLDADIDLDGPDASGEAAEISTGLLGRLGAGRVPFLIWLVSFLTMFGLVGLAIQSVASAVLGVPLYTLIATGLALPPALVAAKFIANWVALLMPKTESSAMCTRHLGGHRGVITQGAASRGKPAEAKIKDRFGNIHYLRVEPLADDAIFAQGSDVTLIRKRGDKFFVI